MSDDRFVIQPDSRSLVPLFSMVLFWSGFCAGAIAAAFGYALYLGSVQ